MARFNCKTHGRTGMVFTCDHFRRDIKDRVKFKKVITAVFLDEEFGKEFEKTFALTYCPDCAAEYDFPIEDSELPDEKFDSMYEKNFSGNYYECFKELNK